MGESKTTDVFCKCGRLRVDPSFKEVDGIFKCHSCDDSIEVKGETVLTGYRLVRAQHADVVESFPEGTAEQLVKLRISMMRKDQLPHAHCKGGNCARCHADKDIVDALRWIKKNVHLLTGVEPA